MRISDWSSDVCSSDLGPGFEETMPVAPFCEHQDVFCAAVENIVENGAEDFVGFARAGAVGKKDARAHRFFTGIFLIDGQMAGMSLSGGNDEFELCIRNEAAADDPSRKFRPVAHERRTEDRKSTRLNSSH